MTHALRLAWRSLLSRAGHTALTIAILALGIGTTTAVYAVAHAVLFAPLPYAAPERVVFVWDSAKERPLTNLTPGRLVDFRERTRTLKGLAGIGHLSFTLASGEFPERLPAASVSANFFDVLGVVAALGRTFAAADADRRQVVLTDTLWRRRFAADPALVGSTIVLDHESYTVSGVLAPGFYWTSITPAPSPGPHPEMFVMAPASDLPAMPVAPPSDLRRDRTTGYLRAVARLRDGATIGEAQAELQAISAELAREFPATDDGRTALLVTARAQLLGAVERPVLLLLAAAILLLAATCANVANLQLMRFSERTRDFLVQAALGAELRRLALQLVAESAMVTAAAGALGVAAAAGVLAFVARLIPVAVPRLASAAIEWPAVAVASTFMAACAAAVACIPLLRMRGTSAPALRERAGTLRLSSRLRRGLVAAEVATAVVLLCGAILFGRSFARLQRVDVGIHDLDRLLTFTLGLDASRRNLAPDRRVALYDDVVRRVRAIPGVQDAGSAATLPIGGDNFGSAATIEGDASGGSHPVGYQVVGAGWFRALGVPVLAGRDVSPADTGADGRVVMVNEAFASQHWRGGNPIGRRLKLNRDGPWMTVVGVAGNHRHLGPKRPARPEVYEPQYQRSFTFAVFVVRTSQDPHAIVAQVRREVAAVDRGIPLAGVATMGEHLRRAQAEMRSLWSLTAVFGALALVIAALGVYGAIGFAVARRMREFGVRLALGASPRQVAAHVMRETFATTGAGVMCGIAIASAGARVMQALLFDTAPGDVASYLGAAFALALVAGLAGAVPASRAMHADPAAVLRAE